MEYSIMLDEATVEHLRLKRQCWSIIPRFFDVGYGQVTYGKLHR